MIVLFIDAFGESADSNARFVQLKGILNSVLQATGSARQGVQLDIRKFNQLTEYLHNDASTKLDRSVLTSFDRIDCIICDGDISSIRPWHAAAQQLYTLLKQCIICDKPCVCAGWTASVLYAVMNTKGEPLKFLPNFPEGGVSDDIKSLKAPPKDEVFYEYRSGNIYEYNARKQQWVKAAQRLSGLGLQVNGPDAAVVKQKLRRRRAGGPSHLSRAGILDCVTQGGCWPPSRKVECGIWNDSRCPLCGG